MSGMQDQRLGEAIPRSYTRPANTHLQRTDRSRSSGEAGYAVARFESVCLQLHSRMRGPFSSSARSSPPDMRQSVRFLPICCFRSASAVEVFGIWRAGQNKTANTYVIEIAI